MKFKKGDLVTHAEWGLGPGRVLGSSQRHYGVMVHVRFLAFDTYKDNTDFKPYGKDYHQCMENEIELYLDGIKYLKERHNL